MATILPTALTAIRVDQFFELPEQILAVVWASGSFGVILNAKGLSLIHISEPTRPY